jgi:hypothetical protein
MEAQPKPPTVKAGIDTFTGDAWFDVIAHGEEPSRPQVTDAEYLAPATEPGR